jgi:hypothetical protein
MKLWLDDLRDPAVFKPGETDWTWIKTAAEAIKIIETGIVQEISFDHDLGEPINETGYSVACHIERLAHEKAIPRIAWHVHSANPVGEQYIKRAMENADRYWDDD